MVPAAATHSHTRGVRLCGVAGCLTVVALAASTAVRPISTIQGRGTPWLRTAVKARHCVRAKPSCFR
jgi:hypothetical protein